MKKIFVVIVSLLVCWFVIQISPVLAVSCGDTLPSDAAELNAYVADCNAKLNQLSGQKQTLSQAVGVLTTQIKLTESKIAAQTAQLKRLEIEITDLEGKIQSLDYSLSDLTKLFVERVRAGYKNQLRQPYVLVVQSSGLPSLIKSVEYIEQVRDHDRNLLIALEKSRLDYDIEKTTKEQKQLEIEKLKLVLDKEKLALATQVTAKNKLLEETKNDEAIYQSKLVAAQAELVAIQGIIAGLGKEVKVKAVSEGESIASIIQGASPCSTGTHLHFEVVQSGSRKNPFEMLKNTSLIWSNDDPAQNGTGSWNWPLNDPIRITQGFGHTSYSSRYTDNLHTGVDMVASNATVKAVKGGDLYQGSMKCGTKNGSPTYLVYVRVQQVDGIDTYYLHVNY